MTQATTAADISASGVAATPADTPTASAAPATPAAAQPAVHRGGDIGAASDTRGANANDINATAVGPVFAETDVPMQRLFHCLDSGYSLNTFLKRFPQVSAEQALDAIGKRMRANDVVRSDRGVLGGTPTFVGARVPVDALFSHLARGADLDEFLEDFPTVSREQAVRALALAQTALDAIAYEASDR